jgi:lycopene cyclase domain-containing protein
MGRASLKILAGKNNMSDSTYLFLILIWSLPIIIAQWLSGIDVLIKRWKVVLPGVLLPTIYFVLIDSLALSSKTWTINTAQSLNIVIPVINVPIEEVVLFLCTNTMIVQGVVFLFSPEMRLRIRMLLRLVRSGPKAIGHELTNREHHE